MKLQTYNYIKQCLEMGHRVDLTKNGATMVRLFEPMNLTCCDEQFWLDIYSDEYKIIPRIPKLLQPGEKCVIIDTEETRSYAMDSAWLKDYKQLIGTVQTIQLVCDGHYYVIGSNSSIPYFMVAPVPPEENKLADVDTDEMVKELESRGLLIDGKVLK